MNEHTLKKTLSKLKIGGIRYFDSIGSTNDEALAWATDNARDLSLVIADEQTQGRGRLNRKWFTPKGSALAFSLILRPASQVHLSRTVGVAALAIAGSCRRLGLVPDIKWPNDILLNGKKMAGILIETVWSGDAVDAVVVGMGVNIHAASVPPEEHLQFPATSIENELGGRVPARTELLYSILESFIDWRARMGTDELVQSWQAGLAFRGQQVQIRSGGEVPVSGELLGLEPDGSLRLGDAHGRSIIVRFGDVSLRPAA